MKTYDNVPAKALAYINNNLPQEIVRRGHKRELCVGICNYNDGHGYEAQKGNIMIWYGTIISGNYVANYPQVEEAVARMKEYIKKYKDMDEIKFMNLGLRRGECLYCRVPLEGDDLKDKHCPRCGLCYEGHGILTWLLVKIARWIVFREILKEDK